MTENRHSAPENAKAMSASVVVFGEVLYDCFPDGRRVLGGAPFNVAWGLKGLGRAPVFVSAVGDDADGREILAEMERWGLPTEGVGVDPEHATGAVHVTLRGGEPTYDICKPRAWDFIPDGGHKAGVLLYHGSLALREEGSRATFEAIRERSGGGRFFDVNLRAPHYAMEDLKNWMRGVDWLKLNFGELAWILDAGDKPFAEAAELVDEVREHYDVGNVIVTAGEDGALLRGSYGEARLSPAPRPREMVDAVGAGDAFSAVAVDGILRGRGADEIVREAAAFAAKVCGLNGATVADPGFYQTNG